MSETLLFLSLFLSLWRLVYFHLIGIVLLDSQLCAAPRLLLLLLLLLEPLSVRIRLSRSLFISFCVSLSLSLGELQFSSCSASDFRKREESEARRLCRLSESNHEPPFLMFLSLLFRRTVYRSFVGSAAACVLSVCVCVYVVDFHSSGKDLIDGTKKSTAPQNKKKIWKKKKIFFWLSL